MILDNGSWAQAIVCHFVKVEEAKAIRGNVIMLLCMGKQDGS